MKTVTIYSTPSCHFCHEAKDFFDANNVTYTDHNVVEDTEKRQEMVDRSGQMGVPVIAVGDGDAAEIVIGFDKDKLAELLEL